MLEELAVNAGFGKKVIYDPKTDKVRVEVDSLAGYYRRLIQRDVRKDATITADSVDY